MSLHEWLSHIVFENVPADAMAEAQNADQFAAERPDRMESGWNRVRPANAQPEFRGEMRPMTAEYGDIGSKLSNAENRTHDAIAKIDRAMAALAHRLDSSERMKALSETAMNAAAEAMNATSREQAGAIGNIDKTVKALSDRLAQVETGLTNGSSREAVKALEHTLTAQIAAIQAQVERAERRSAEAAGAVSFSISGLSERLNAFDDRKLKDIEGKVSALEARERETQGGIKEAIQRIAQRIEADKRNNDARTTKADADATRIDADLKRLDHDLRQAMRELGARMDGAAQRDADGRARLDEQLATLNARLDVAARPAEAPAGRFEAIEEQVELLSQQFASAEKKQGDNSAAAEQALRGLGTRIETSDKRTRDALQQLQATVESILKRMETIEAAPRAPGFANAIPHGVPADLSRSEPPRMEMARGELAPPPPGPGSREPGLREQGPPRSPNAYPSPFPPAGPSPFDPPPPRGDLPPAFGPQMGPQPGNMGYPGQQEPDGIILPDPEPEPQPRRTDDFIAAARRAAQAAAQGDAQIAAKALQDRAATAGAVREKSGTLRIALIAAGLVVFIGGLYVLLNLNGGDGNRPAPGTSIGDLIEGAPGTGTTSSDAPFSELPPPVTTGAPVTVPPPESTEAPVTSLPPREPEETVATLPEMEPGPTPLVPPVTAPPVTTPPAAELPVSEAPPPVVAPSVLEALIRAAERGDAKAQYLYGLRFAEGEGVPQDDVKAAEWIAKSADQGLPIAQYRMGVLFERGKGVSRDLGTAMEWYERAARAGNRKAMHNLAVIYADGSSGQPDYAQAARWFQAGAELGLKDSQFNLAILFERGLGIQPDLIEAYRWYAAAAAQGDADARARVAAIEQKLSADDLTKARALAERFRPKPMNPAANEAPVFTS